MDAVLKLRSIFLYDTSKISRATIVLIEDFEKSVIEIPQRSGARVKICF